MIAESFFRKFLQKVSAETTVAALPTVPPLKTKKFWEKVFAESLCIKFLLKLKKVSEETTVAALPSSLCASAKNHKNLIKFLQKMFAESFSESVCLKFLQKLLSLNCPVCLRRKQILVY